MERIARFFEFDERNTNFSTETMGGVTTFMTMAYIVVVNPGILSDAVGGELFGELVFATCVSAAIATLLMGVLANYPFALAPGMGLNAFFTYGVVLGMGVHWELALGVVLASGLLFVLLTLFRVREVIITAVPEPLKRATAAGIGMFIAFVGLKNAGLIVADEATLVSLGDVRSGPVGLVLLGILGTGVMLVRKVNGAILLGVLGVAALAMVVGVSPWPNGLVSLPVFPVHLFGVAVENLPIAFHVELIGLVFAFLFVDLFDTMGTLVGLSERVGFLDKSGQLPRANRALMADSVGSVCGGILGTSTVTTYIESASGISAGARTGFANVVTGLLFLVALFFTPLIQAIPSFATSPALVMVGVMMMLPVTKIDWQDVSDALPAFLTLIAIPLTFSISDGLALGFISYPIVKRLGGYGDTVHPIVDVLAVVFIAKYLFM
ncbi:MAG: AGZA family xanthine/uracil permease-like MFS transporter [Candidatus Latescibacterota bacterium]|jgi:AGZA family xanthine/uracil permease-like MFS transporter